MNKFTGFNQQSDSLFILIKSLTKSEKRQFNLYVGRLGGNIDAKFFTLFKFLENVIKRFYQSMYYYSHFAEIILKK